MWYREYQDCLWQGAKFVEDIRAYTSDAEPENMTRARMGISQVRQRVVRLGIYCGDTLISDDVTPYNHKLNINKFPFIPFFCFRKKNGEPYGYVAPLRDVQREFNKRRSKALHILNTAQVIMDDNAADVEESREEAARPDGVLLKKPGSELTIERNLNLAASPFNIMN